MVKSSPSEPRKWTRHGYEVDLARDDQANCRSCNAAIYWVWIRTKKGEVKRHPVSEAKAVREGGKTFLPSHYSDCPDAERFRRGRAHTETLAGFLGGLAFWLLAIFLLMLA